MLYVQKPGIHDARIMTWAKGLLTDTSVSTKNDDRSWTDGVNKAAEKSNDGCRC